MRPRTRFRLAALPSDFYISLTNRSWPFLQTES